MFPHSVVPSALNTSPDGRWLITATRDEPEEPNSTIRVWDLTKPTDSSPKVAISVASLVTSCAIGNNDQWIAAVQNSEILLCNLLDHKVKRKILLDRDPQAAGLGTGVFQVAISPNGHWLFAVGYDHRAHLWDLRHHVPKRIELFGHRGIQDVAFSPDGMWLAAGGPLHAQLWNLNANDVNSTLRMIRAHDGPLRNVAISADNRWLVTDAIDGAVRRWTLDTTQLLKQAQNLVGRQPTVREQNAYDLRSL